MSHLPVREGALGASRAQITVIAAALLGQLFTALADPTGVIAHRPGALERVALLLQDWRSAADKLTDTETRMTDVLDELKLTDLATSIPGLSAVGDPRRGR
jgi:hypothetical protein